MNFNIQKSFFFQAEDGIRDFCLSRGLGDVYKRQVQLVFSWAPKLAKTVRVNIGFPGVRTDGGRSVTVRSRDYQIFKDG